MPTSTLTSPSPTIIKTRIINQQRELLYWEETTLRDSLCSTLDSTLQHLIFTMSLDIAVELSSELLQKQRIEIFFDYEQLMRDVTIADVEDLKFRHDINLASQIEHTIIDEEQTRSAVFGDCILAHEHPSMVLECHHGFLAACFETDLNLLRSARDVKLAEQQCEVLAQQEEDERRIVLESESAKWSIDLYFIYFLESRRRIEIQVEQNDLRENKWTCPICAVIRPAKNSMLAEVNSSHPIRGEDMLQMHLLHHAADVTRRRTIRNATLKEEFIERRNINFSAFSSLVAMCYDCGRGLLLLHEEQTRYKKFEDPAAWRAGIRAAIEATRKRQIRERETIEYRELMTRLETEEESERFISEEILFGMDVLDPNGDFLLQRITNNNNQHNNEKGGDHDDRDQQPTAMDDEEYSSFLSLEDYESPKKNRNNNTNSSGYSIICRNNIETIWTLFEERLNSQKPLAEDERLFNEESLKSELLPALPVEASHVRRKMGTDEGVSENDRFLFGSSSSGNAVGGNNNRSSLSPSARRGNNNQYTDLGFDDIFGPAVDKLFSHFDHHRHQQNYYDQQQQADGDDENANPLDVNYFNINNNNDDDFIFDDDDDDDSLFDSLFLYHSSAAATGAGRGRHNNNRRKLLLLKKKKKRRDGYHDDDDDQNSSYDGSDYSASSSIDSSDMFELELELDELQRKEIGSRRAMIELEWQRRVMLEKRLSVMPVTKLSIPQHERNMMALMKLEPFYRNQISRECWSEMERLFVVIDNEEKRAIREDRQRRNAVMMKPRPPFRGGGRAIVANSNSNNNSNNNDSFANNKKQRHQLPNNHHSNDCGSEHQQKRLPPSSSSSSSAQNNKPQQQVVIMYEGFPADRLMTSLLRLETQLQTLFSSVAERRNNIAFEFSMIEEERLAALKETRTSADAPSWTTTTTTTSNSNSSAAEMFGSSSSFYSASAAAAANTTGASQPQHHHYRPRRPQSSSSSMASASRRTTQHYYNGNTANANNKQRPTSARSATF